MEEILALIREGNADMQAKKDSSLRTVVKELVKEKGKASPHINKYACLKFNKDQRNIRELNIFFDIERCLFVLSFFYNIVLI